MSTLLKKSIKNNLSAVKPFIHYMGGKSRLLKAINKKLPTQFNNYFEPFVGGGALFFDLEQKQSFISDMNLELILTYKVIRDNVEALIIDLQKHHYNSDYYYAIRDFEREFEAFEKLSDIQRASRYLYLNKSGYNGLHRINKKGFNNVAYNKKDREVNYDANNLRLVSQYLENVEIQYNDFNSIRSKVKSGDFIYLDPPYYASNQNYTKDGFSLDKHIELVELCDYIDKMGGYFLLSNSYNETTLNLYDKYNIDFVDVRQNINPDASKRHNTKEILVSNYTNYAVANNTNFQNMEVA